MEPLGSVTARRSCRKFWRTGSGPFDGRCIRTCGRLPHAQRPGNLLRIFVQKIIQVLLIAKWHDTPEKSFVQPYLANRPKKKSSKVQTTTLICFDNLVLGVPAELLYGLPILFWKRLVFNQTTNILHFLPSKGVPPC